MGEGQQVSEHPFCLGLRPGAAAPAGYSSPCLKAGASRPHPFSVIEGPLNPRAEPSTEAIAVGLIEVGVELSMLGQTADGWWLNVRTKDGDEGWVFAQYVEMHN